MGGRRTGGSPPARAGSWKDDQGHRGTGAGSASRHGGGLGRVHPHDRVPGIPLSYRTKLHPAARGQARASYWLRSPSSPAPDKGQRQARSTVDSLSTGDLSRLATFLRLLTGSLFYHRQTDTWVAVAVIGVSHSVGFARGCALDRQTDIAEILVFLISIAKLAAPSSHRS